MGAKYVKLYINAFNDEKVMKIEYRFGLNTGFGLYVKLLLIMCESDDHKIHKKDMSIYAMRLHMKEQDLTDYLDHCIEINLFDRDKSGYYSSRFMVEMVKADGISEKNREKALQQCHQLLTH